MWIGLLLFVACFNYNVWLRLDKRYKMHYIKFFINGSLCVLTILIVIYFNMWTDVLSLAIAEILFITSSIQKKQMFKELRKKRT